MPGPLGSDLHVDQLLTNLSLAYRNKSYIADQIFPLVPVNKQSDIVPKYDQSHWFRDGAKVRARGSKSEGGGWTVDTSDTYFCNRYSFRKEVADEDRDNADAPFSLDREATEFVTDKLQMNREVAFAGAQFITATWTTDKDGGADFTKWSDYGASTPLTDIDTYKDDVEALIGIEPNVMVMGKQVWLKLRWHPDLMEVIKYTQKGQVGVDLFASMIEVPKVLIGRSIYTTTAEGTAEASVSYTRIWGKHALLIYVPERPSLLTPAAGYTFTWNRVANSLQWIKRMRDEEKEIDIIESNSYYAQKRTAARAGAFLENAVA